MSFFKKKLFIFILVFTVVFVSGLFLYKKFNETKIPKSAKLVLYLKNNDILF
jgi:hypothetical protein